MDSNTTSKPKILIIPNMPVTPSILIALAVLNDQNKNDSEVEVFAPGTSFSSYENLSLANIKVTSELPEQKFLLRFKNQQNKIKGIQWNQDETDINLYVTMDKGEFNSKDLEFSYAGGFYRKIFLLNVAKFDQIPSFDKAQYEYLLSRADVAAIGTELEEELPNKKSYYTTENSGLTEDLIEYSTSENINSSQLTLTLMLAGIYMDTNSFKERIKSAKTFQTASKLIEQGANFEKAQEIVKSLDTE